MSFVPLITVVLVFSIPILGILLAGYKEWLKFKTKHQELGSSTREVEENLEALHERLKQLEEERDDLRERVQNLETIVTSEAWIAQHEQADETSVVEAAEAGKLELPPPPEEDARGDVERSARLARRLRNR